MDIKKTKEMKKILEKICPETSRVVLISDKQIKTGITNVDVKNISILDLAPSGTPDRVIIFTENSIRELGKLK
jgi:hypothetical protein